MTSQELFKIENDEFRKEFLLDLAYFCKPYVNDVINKVISKIDLIIENETILKMLHELRVRTEKEFNKFVENLGWRLGQHIDSKDYDMKYDLHNNCLTHSQSYRDILYDLLIK